MNFKSLISQAQATAKRFAADITPSGVVAGATAIAVLGAMFDIDPTLTVGTCDADMNMADWEVDTLQEAIDAAEDFADTEAGTKSWSAYVFADDELVFQRYDN